MKKLPSMGLCFIAFILLAIVPAYCSKACDESDYSGTYTQCINNTRNVIWYWNTDCTVGDVTLPPNRFGIPCDISCDSGFYLPLGQTECAQCEAGSFSIGGGLRISSWEPSWDTQSDYITASYWCEDLPTYEVVDCPIWSQSEEGNWLKSSNITHSQQTSMELVVFFRTDGHVHFEYQVDSEPGYDVFSFKIGDEYRLHNINDTNGQWLTYKTAVPKGIHLLTWIYMKDYSVSQGEDGVLIRMMELGGLVYADSSCTLCSPGQYNNEKGSEDCLPCPVDTFSSTSGTTECEACDIHYYSVPGSTSCDQRQPCTASDYEYLFTPCNNAKRTKYYKWLEPRQCDNTTMALPADETNLACAPCQPGTYFDGSSCRTCDTGYASSLGALSCDPCGAGTAAVKGVYLHTWDDWPQNFKSSCKGDCALSTWRLLGSSIDSGVGHGKTVTSEIVLNVTLGGPGTITFNYTLSCSSGCSLSFIDQGFAGSQSYTSRNKNKMVTLPLTLGEDGTGFNHTLKWVFNKHDSSNRYPTDRVIIYSIEVEGVVTGGAKECVGCVAGTYADELSDTCGSCTAGQSSSDGSDSCTPCEPGFFNDQEGGLCTPCGHGTTSLNYGSTACTNDCTYTPDGNPDVKYDLSQLTRDDARWGPIPGTRYQTYSFNVCSKNRLNDGFCINGDGEEIESYACQLTNHAYSVDLGDQIAFYDYVNDTSNGVILNYWRGEPCRGGVERALNVTFICDPEAGVGAPEAPADNVIEWTVCQYAVEWRSIYGCPVCSQRDIAFAFTDCENGKQRKVHYWKENPRKCHDGLELPPDELLDCIPPTVPCPAGTYNPRGTTNCTDCQAGFYSIGGGVEYYDWSELPQNFSTAGWVLRGEYIEAAVESDSELNYTVTILGTSLDRTAFLTYHYSLYPGRDGKLQVYINNVLHTTHSEFTSYNDHVIPLSYGINKIMWKYIAQDRRSFRSSATIRRIEVIGNSLAALRCTVCPTGFASSSGSTACTPCPGNTYANASVATASDCRACPAGTFSVPQSGGCTPLEVCSTSQETDYQYTPCDVNWKRVKYVKVAEPGVCTIDTIPPNVTEDCPPCPAGSFRRGSVCDYCTAPGQIWNNGNCESVPSGQTVRRQREYFTTSMSHGLPQPAFEDTQVWPFDGWSTQCVGDCGTSGWRLRGNYIDSGYHQISRTRSVDSSVFYEASFIQHGTISFSLNAIVSSVTFVEFFIDGKPMTLDRTHSTGKRVAVQYSYPVSAGVHQFAWNYHSDPNVRTDPASISNVVVTGLEQGAPVAYTCPAGTSTTTDSCQPCVPGTFSSMSGSSTCTTCPMDQYSDSYGAVSCSSCGEGTFTTGTGSTSCLTDCQFDMKFQSYEITYDLAPLADLQVAVNTDDGKYVLQVCEKFTCRDDSTVGPRDTSTTTSICFDPKQGTDVFDYGNTLSFIPGVNESQFSLQYMHGDNENCDASRSTVIKFVCNLTAEVGHPILEFNDAQRCQVRFVWESAHACRTCTEEDYTQVIEDTGCSGGKEQVVMVKSSECFGEDTINAHTRKCSPAIKFPVTLVVVGGLLFVALIVFSVIFYIRHRKVSHKYNLLLNDRGIEMDEPSNFIDD